MVTVDRALKATERRWREEVKLAGKMLEEVDLELADAGRVYQGEEADKNDAVRAEAYSRCMRALARRDSLKRKLLVLQDPRELERRLETSRKLAELRLSRASDFEASS